MLTLAPLTDLIAQGEQLDMEFKSYRRNMAFYGHGLNPAKARTACFNSGQRTDDHFVDVTEMVEVGSALREDFKRLLRENHDCP